MQTYENNVTNFTAQWHLRRNKTEHSTEKIDGKLGTITLHCVTKLNTEQI